VIDSELRVPLWAEIASWALSFVGLGLSIYLTITHFEPQALVCSDSGVINCTKVTTSWESNLFGVPVAILGLVMYTVMVVINSPWAWRSPWRRLHVARFVLIILSMAFVLWLLFAEIILIGNICLYCTGVHLTTFLLLIVISLVAPTQLGWSRSRTS